MSFIIRKIWILVNARNQIIIYSILGGFAALVVFLYLFRLLRFKGKKGLGIEIEKSIPNNTTRDNINQLISNAAVNQQYQHAIIYLFYKFRLYCKEKLVIRSAFDITTKELENKIAGTPDISLKEIQKLFALYEKALQFSTITYDEYYKTKEILKNITSNY